jgi:7-carboxy-7-deazaguanine synthase
MLISEIFYSLQGEGILIGTPTVFIRTAGCDLRCKWCDTEYAFENGIEMAIDEIIGKAENYGSKNACITGGEPLIQNEISKLIQKLIDKNYLVTVETGGAHSIEILPCDDNITISLDIKCPSSGMHNRMNFSNIELLSINDQLKFVIADGEDYKYAKDIIAKYKPICRIIMQPVGGRDLKQLAENVLNDRLNVQVLPQLHKLIWGERRGV